MTVSGFLAWATAFIAGFFISGAINSIILIPLAPANAGVGYALFFALTRLSIWLLIVFLAARAYRAARRKPEK